MRFLRIYNPQNLKIYLYPDRLIDIREASDLTLVHRNRDDMVVHIAREAKAMFNSWSYAIREPQDINYQDSLKKPAVKPVAAIGNVKMTPKNPPHAPDYMKVNPPHAPDYMKVTPPHAPDYMTVKPAITMSYPAGTHHKPAISRIFHKNLLPYTMKTPNRESTPLYALVSPRAFDKLA